MFTPCSNIKLLLNQAATLQQLPRFFTATVVSDMSVPHVDKLAHFNYHHTNAYYHYAIKNHL